MTNLLNLGKSFVDYSRITHAEFKADIEVLFSSEEARAIDRAYNLSKYGHRNQERQGGDRYFEHPKEVAIILYKEFGVRDAEVIIAALLHDIVEDSFILDIEGLEILFGKRVAQMTRVLTKLPKAGYILRLASLGEVGAWLVKLADNLHNTRTLDACDLEKQNRKVEETLSLYYPLIEKVDEAFSDNENYRGLAKKIRKLFDEAIDYLGDLPK